MYSTAYRFVCNSSDEINNLNNTLKLKLPAAV